MQSSLSYVILLFNVALTELELYSAGRCADLEGLT